MRRLEQYRPYADINYDSLRLTYQTIEEIAHGHGSSGGYRTVWHTLEMEGIRIPQKFVQKFLKEIDPAGCERRRQHSIRRRQYVNPGPDFAWHIDGYDKLKPWGFPIHGAIDGYSRKILWLKVARTNNSSDMVRSFYLQTVGRLGSCPVN